VCITEKKIGFRDRGSERGPTQGVREESERDGGREGEREREKVSKSTCTHARARARAHTHTHTERERPSE